MMHKHIEQTYHPQQGLLTDEHERQTNDSKLASNVLDLYGEKIFQFGLKMENLTVNTKNTKN